MGHSDVVGFCSRPRRWGSGRAWVTGAAWPRSRRPAAEDLKVGPDAVRFRPEIEPVVRWIEETPRERALEVAIAKLKEGLSYRDLLAGPVPGRASATSSPARSASSSTR